MQQKQVAAVISQHFSVIARLTRKVVVHFDKQVVYDLRLEIKKLRAFLDLLHLETGKAEPKIRTRLKSFNGYIGIIHNIQLQLQVINELAGENTAVIEEYLQRLNAEAHGWKREITKLTLEHLHFDEDRDAMLRAVPAQLSKTTVRRYLKHKADEIESLLILKPVEENTLHQLRKILKDIQFNWPYLQPEAASLLPYEFTGLAQIQALTGLLAAYGDQCSALDLLQPNYVNCVQDPRGRELLQLAHRELQRRKEQLKKDFITSLLTFRQKAQAGNFF